MGRCATPLAPGDVRRPGEPQRRSTGPPCAGRPTSRRLAPMDGSGSRRRAARVVVLDPADRILLINARDPFGRDRRDWWEIPGGGIDRGEHTHDAVRRELWEEAGIRDAEIGPCVWTQTVRFTFAGLRFDQDEWVHVARCDGSRSPTRRAGSARGARVRRAALVGPRPAARDAAAHHPLPVARVPAGTDRRPAARRATRHHAAGPPHRGLARALSPARPHRRARSPTAHLTDRAPPRRRRPRPAVRHAVAVRCRGRSGTTRSPRGSRTTGSPRSTST